MAVHWIIHAIILIGLGIATVTDIKKREVPDTLNFGLIILGVVIGILGSVFSKSWQPCITSILGLGIGYGVGALMFYTGQWGGGDAKMLMGMGAILGTQWTEIISLFNGTQNIPFFFTTIITIFIAGGIYGFAYAIFLIIKNRKEFKIEFRRKREEKNMIKVRKIVLGATALIVLGMLLVDDKFLKMALGIIAVFVFFGQYLFIISKVVEKVCMIKTVPIRALTEGDWIVEDIIVKGKRICGPKDLGISLEQIEELKKNKIRTIKIKEGIPFIPGFLLGYILMVVFGNWLVYFL
ncbi:prepilin peptidase [Candidatus Woesearchaeota archaeon]|nr:prepilin peptidase [Candidatus Woesearchaeota archaeon]